MPAIRHALPARPRLPHGSIHPRLAGVALVVALAFGLAPTALGPDGTPAADVEGAVASPSPSFTAGVRLVVPLGQPDPRLEPVVPTPAPPDTLRGYVWPLPNGRLTLPFGPSHWGSRIVDGEKFHDGIDLATFCGDRIVAAHDGVVLAAGRRFDEFMGWKGDLGPYFSRLDGKALWHTLPIVVVIDDGNGYRSVYAHFNRVVVEPGQTVKAGDLLGYEGATGRATGCHLHYGLFSPLEQRAFQIDPAVVERILVPSYQVARIDPLDVLPSRPDPRATPTPPRSGP